MDYCAAATPTQPKSVEGKENKYIFVIVRLTMMRHNLCYVIRHREIISIILSKSSGPYLTF